MKTSLAPGSTVVTDYLEQGRPDRVPRRAPVQPGRLRLHHLHRQLRAAAGGDLGGDRGEGPGGLRGALRQPQLRGPDQPGREGQLPGQPAAGRRLRAGRADGPRPDQRAAGRGLRRRAGLPARHLARRRGDQGGGRRARSPRRCSPATTPRSSRATRPGTRSRSPRATATPGPTRPTCASPTFFEGMPAEPPGVEPIAGARVLALLGDSITTDHISPAGAIKKDSPAGQLADRAGGRAAATSTPTAPAAATTR